MTENIVHSNSDKERRKPDDEQRTTPDGDVRMTFTEHLGELRTRIMISGAAVIISFFVCYAFGDTLFQIVSRPLQPLQDSGIVVDPNTGEPADVDAGDELKWQALNFMEPFLVKLKLAAYGGILLSLPIIVFQICSFIFPGLKPKERRAVRMILSGSVALGTAGTAISYFLVFPIVLQYLLQWAPEGIEITLRMNENVSLLIKGYLAFAIAFQFPLVVLVLVYLDLLSPKTLREYRKFAVVGIAFMSALFTPPDPMSMVIMMVPMYLLYEISIWLSYFVVRRNATEPKPD